VAILSYSIVGGCIYRVFLVDILVYRPWRMDVRKGQRSSDLISQRHRDLDLDKAINKETLHSRNIVQPFRIATNCKLGHREIKTGLGKPAVCI